MRSTSGERSINSTREKPEREHLNLDIILRNSTPEEFAFSSQINLVGILAIEHELTFLETFLLLSMSSGLFPEPVVSLGHVERSMFRNSTGDIEKAQFG